ncbi:MAG TPA: 30S ribosomal protein S17 [Armatimonadetes bacterium]|jgi:small subunit ribosomal protein S17|nr:30S ribosomal protein S17 [Armatimonadota bacterium]
MSNTTDKKLKTQEGIVVSDKMDKSVVVEVQRFTRHPLYERVLRRSTRFHAHDEENRCRVGDRVLIAECRPISKTKCWRVVEVLAKGE